MLHDLRFRTERAEAELQHANRKIARLLSRDALALGFQETERRVRDASRRTFERKSVDGSHNSSNADVPEHTWGHRRTSSTPVDLDNTDAGDADLELRLASAAAAAMAGVLALSGDSPTFGVAPRSSSSSNSAPPLALLHLPPPRRAQQLGGVHLRGGGGRRRGRGVIEKKHSNDVEYRPPPPRVCTSIHAEGKSCSDLGLSTCSQRPSYEAPAVRRQRYRERAERAATTLAVAATAAIAIYASLAPLRPSAPSVRSCRHSRGGSTHQERLPSRRHSQPSCLRPAVASLRVHAASLATPYNTTDSI